MVDPGFDSRFGYRGGGGEGDYGLATVYEKKGKVLCTTEKSNTNKK